MSTISKVLQALRDYSTYFLWLAGILIIIINLWAGFKLRPIEQNLAVMAKDISSVQQQVNAIQAQHSDFVTKETFDQVVTRIDHISNRVDQIYSIVAEKK